MERLIRKTERQRVAVEIHFEADGGFPIDRDTRDAINEFLSSISDYDQINISIRRVDD